jgi:HD-GYP domain-containing protein (c-di-GMP phosphodiesterase class II)
VLSTSVQTAVKVAAQLAAALEFKDHGTQGHNRRVSELCVKIGRELGMSPSELDVLALSGLLHDVGKLGIPDAILDKHHSLDESEWAMMRKHPELGLAILGRAGSFKRELLGVLYHHERMDGSGYPYGLVADAIPVEARIVAVADTYDVLTSNRPYRKARGVAEARRVMRREAATRLDRDVVGALIRVLDKGLFAPDALGGSGLMAASA